MPIFGVQNWRAPELPGFDAEPPPGASQVQVNHRLRGSYLKIRRTFDNVKTVESFKPYAEIAEELRDAVLEELAAGGFRVGPSVSLIVDAAVRQDMWSRFLEGRAVSTDDENLRRNLAKVAIAAMTAGAKSIAAAHELHSKLRAEEMEAARADPLAAFVEAEPESKP